LFRSIEPSTDICWSLEVVCGLWDHFVLVAIIDLQRRDAPMGGAKTGRAAAATLSPRPEAILRAYTRDLRRDRPAL
jgi:hypothetical protein